MASEHGLAPGSRFAVGAGVTVADLYLVTLVRNGLGAGIDVGALYPWLNAVWLRCLAVPEIHACLVECGGIVQPGGVRPPPGSASLPAGRPRL